MARTAEYSIRGYLYQFLKYLVEIANAPQGSSITIEGAVEDIDVSVAGSVTALQCKYHEQVEKFTLGKIYKPVLLMLEHFAGLGASSPVSYVLFCHFPGRSGTERLTIAELDTIIGTQGEALKKIVARLPATYDRAEFLRRFTIEFGPDINTLQAHALEGLRKQGFSAEDIDAIIFPAALQRIVDISTRGGLDERTVEPHQFLSALRQTRQVTFTRWTRELTTKAKIFQRLRKDLKASLGRNTRKRYLVMEPDRITDFDSDIVRFIEAFADAYSHKYLHEDPPLFIFPPGYDLDGVTSRLYDRGVKATAGLVGATYRFDKLFEAPMRHRGPPARLEYRVRLTTSDRILPLSQRPPDDLFLVNADPIAWVTKDVNVQCFDIDRLDQLEYAMSLRGSYD